MTRDELVKIIIKVAIIRKINNKNDNNEQKSGIHTYVQHTPILRIWDLKEKILNLKKNEEIKTNVYKMHRRVVMSNQFCFL